MKTIYLVLVVMLFSVFNLQAQNEKEYRISTNLDTYVGTWEYATDTDTFQIVLNKGQKIMGDMLTDCLFGVHFYKKEGVVVSDYRYLLPNINDDNQTIYATNAVLQEKMNGFKPNQLRVIFCDEKHRKVVNAWLIRDPNKPNELLWEFDKKRWREVIYFSDTPESEKELPGYSVPDNVILKKIK